jgi:hypothetical protein
MPLSVRIPVGEAPANFASRARKRGLGFLLTQASVSLPGPNVFLPPKGIGVISSAQKVLFPGPNLFVRPRGMGKLIVPRGAGAFCITANPPPVFPGRDVFAQFQMARNCKACAHPCAKRGMGQDDGLDVNFSSVLEGSPTSATLIPPVDFSSALETSPTSATLVAPTLPTTPAATSGYGGTVTAPVSDPQLDAYNQALSNALGNGQSSSQAIAAATAAAANAGASIAKITSLNSSASKSIAATPTTAPPAGYQWTYNAASNSWQATPTATSSITTWLTNNIGTVAVGAIGLTAIALLAGKGKR